MYVPPAFQLDDPDAVRRIIDDYGFALLVTCEDGVPAASHLPLLHDPDPAPRGRLIGHLARANGQVGQLAAAMRNGREVLAVFQGPHSYVSPNDYGPPSTTEPATVPTWNYQAVHVYGVPRLMTEAEEVRGLLDRLTARHEAGRAPAWSPAQLDPAIIDRMVQGIQGFEIAITRIQAAAKLSQNRTTAQAARAAARLEASAEPLARETGRRMRAALDARS
jgi:transcriptional regulator